MEDLATRVTLLEQTLKHLDLRNNLDYFHKKIIGFEKIEQDNQSIIHDIKKLHENQDNLLELSQMK